ncbi:MAG: hypothetical protein GY775_21050 [Candidatus Scalindua sp.]|nr:hypothetical protein [Candidatus Scalindua sp.]
MENETNENGRSRAYTVVSVGHDTKITWNRRTEEYKYRRTSEQTSTKDNLIAFSRTINSRITIRNDPLNSIPVGIDSTVSRKRETFCKEGRMNKKKKVRIRTPEII